MELRQASIGKYKLIKKLGSGGTSKVKLGYEPESNTYVAIKIIKPGKLNPSHEEVEKEIDILSTLKHPNIVNLIEIQESAQYIKKNGTSYSVIAIILELAGAGDLFEYIAVTGRFSEITARTFFKVLIETVEYCHTQGIAHRDLKPENVLLDEDFKIKLADFGLATFCGKENDNKLHTAVGTELYMAPEIHFQEPYLGTAADVFACGVLLFVMVSGHPPFWKADPRSDNFYKCFCLRKFNIFWAQHERNKPRKPNQEFYCSEFKSLINGMMNPDSSLRLTLQEIESHPWLQGPVLTSEELKKEFSEKKSMVYEERQRQWEERQMIKERARNVSDVPVECLNIRPY